MVHIAAGASSSRHSRSKERVEVIRRTSSSTDCICRESGSCGREVESCDQILGIAVCRGRGWRRGLFWWYAEYVLLEELNYVLDVGCTGSFKAIVRGGYEIVDRELVFAEEGVDVFLVDDSSALGLGKDEVEEETEADPRVERNPGLAQISWSFDSV